MSHFSAIPWRDITFWWDDDDDDDDNDARFVLDQQAELNLHSASSLKNSPQLDMSLHQDTLLWFRANQTILGSYYLVMCA